MKDRPYPTCPNCGSRVIAYHLDQGHEVCMYCGPTRDLDCYTKLERERYLNWVEQYEDDQLDKIDATLLRSTQST